jgi:hypothetical protein
MLSTNGPVLVDCQVAELDSCYPMIPSGAAHTEMLLGPSHRQTAARGIDGALVWSCLSVRWNSGFIYNRPQSETGGKLRDSSNFGQFIAQKIFELSQIAHENA